MNQQRLIQDLAASAGQVPAQADVLGLQQFSLDQMQERTRRFLAVLGDAQQRSFERGDWLVGDAQTTIRLPQGARALLYHASGGMKYASGMAPLQSRFASVEAKDSLTAKVEEAARKFNIRAWTDQRGELTLERLWRTTAQGVGKDGKLADTVLCRVVGAYRHAINGVPVLGAASVALRLAGDGALDALAVQVRSVADVLEKAAVVAPEVAAQRLALQLSGLLGTSRNALPDNLVEAQDMRFGYINLGKRKSQQLLAPAYVAQLVLRHQEGRQAYSLVAAATEKTYLPLCQCGADALTMSSRTAPQETGR